MRQILASSLTSTKWFPNSDGVCIRTLPFGIGFCNRMHAVSSIFNFAVIRVKRRELLKQNRYSSRSIIHSLFFIAFISFLAVFSVFCWFSVYAVLCCFRPCSLFLKIYFLLFFQDCSIVIQYIYAYMRFGGYGHYVCAHFEARDNQYLMLPTVQNKQLVYLLKKKN